MFINIFRKDVSSESAILSEHERVPNVCGLHDGLHAEGGR